MTDSEDGVRITNQMIYDKVSTVEKAVSVLPSLVAAKEDHEIRIRGVEEKQRSGSRIAATLTAIATGIALLLGALTNFFKGTPKP